MYSLTTDSIVTTTGTARIAPPIPESRAPIRIAMIVTRGGKHTAFLITYGTTIWFSSCWTTKYKPAAKRANNGEIVNATRIAGTAEMIGPTVGITSIKPAK